MSRRHCRGININIRLYYFSYIILLYRYDSTNDVYHEENTDDKPVYGADIRAAYGNDIYTRLTKFMSGLHAIVQIDKRIMQMALVIFLFSKGFSATINSNELIINNHKHIFQVQNKYTEHLWLFIEKTCGQGQAVSIFSKLIGKYLHIQEIIRDINHEVYDKLDPCQVPPILRILMQPA